MIALLTGRVASLEPASCVIATGSDESGVGYLVHASTRTLASLARPPQTVRLLIETVVREDAILLYGFVDATERDWFRLLTTVQGVGAKVALGILSSLPPAELASAIAAGNRAALGRAQGVGPKLAARLVTELRERAATFPTPGSATGETAAPAPSGVAADALSALTNLGYRRAEAAAAIDRVLARNGGQPILDQLVRDTLRELAGRMPARE